MGRTYRVGERGPELLTMGANGYVTNAAATKSLMGASATGGAIQGTLTVERTGVAAIDALLAVLEEHFRFQVRTTANGNAQEYWGTENGG